VDTCPSTQTPASSPQTSHDRAHLFEGAIEARKRLIRHVRVAVDNHFELPARTHGGNEGVDSLVTHVVVAEVELVQRRVARQNLCQMPARGRTGGQGGTCGFSATRRYGPVITSCGRR
jgi:hypothetical protein